MYDMVVVVVALIALAQGTVGFSIFNIDIIEFYPGVERRRYRVVTVFPVLNFVTIYLHTSYLCTIHTKSNSYYIINKHTLCCDT